MIKEITRLKETGRRKLPHGKTEALRDDAVGGGGRHNRPLIAATAAVRLLES